MTEWKRVSKDVTSLGKALRKMADRFSKNVSKGLK